VPPATASKLVQVLVSQLRKQLLGSDVEIVTRGARNTRDPTPAGTRSAPDLARAHRLIAASGTRGARVRVWGFTGRCVPVVRYAGSVLRRPGFRVRIRVLPNSPRYFDYVNDPRRHAQVGLYGWERRLPHPVELLRAVPMRRPRDWPPPPPSPTCRAHGRRTPEESRPSPSGTRDSTPSTPPPGPT